MFNHPIQKAAAVLALSVSLLSSCNASKEISIKADLDPVIANVIASVSKDSLYSYVEDLVAFKTRHSMSIQTSATEGIGAAVSYIESNARRWAKEAGRNDISVRELRYVNGGPQSRMDRFVNVPEVLVTIPGTEGSSEILLMAHIDTRVADLADSTTYAPGADDDGSGLACLLETVRLVSKIPLKQTVKCLFVSCEEQNLGGSQYAASVAKEEGWPLIAVLNNDMIGNSLASETGYVVDNVVRVFSESKSGEDSDNRQLARYVKEMGEKYVPGHEVKLMYRNDRYRRSGDHSSFMAEGFTAVRVCEYCENYEKTHQVVRVENGISYGDIIEDVDFEYLTKNTKVNLAAVLSLASAPAKPQSARIANASALSNVTALSWAPVLNKDGNPDSTVEYEILMRETDTPVWSVVKKCPAATTIEAQKDTIAYSKDNYFYAVRSISASGNPSLPVVCR
ncbi:MAG: M20/M25/M40 family metallo-hydrolase [Bacteroidales bacterium]|nr:M20/M25/M40 family metallo-hydrolase [Bacteroidales bacterium]